MADGITFEITGLKELDKAMKKLERRTQRNVGIKSLRKGANLIKDRAKELAPKTGYGTLAKSMGTAVRRGRYGKLEMHVLPRKGKKQKYDGYYAHFVEFGTAPHKIGKRQHPGTEAQPFLRPAAEQMADKAIKAVGESLFFEIQRELKKL